MHNQSAEQTRKIPPNGTRRLGHVVFIFFSLAMAFCLRPQHRLCAEASLQTSVAITENRTAGTHPLSPVEALRTFQTKPEFTVELVASEPLIVDPVAIDFGADGKLWVVEMHDYPSGMDGNWKPGGRVKFLQDLDRDGKFETATTFLGDLPFPTGVMAWCKGVLICAAPDIIYAEDTNGDGRADKVEKLFTGFVTENYQARVNGLSYGLDNWIYGANGLLGGSIKGTFAGKTIDIRGRDFRMDPDTGAFEPVAGLTQQGRVRDDWGNWFGNDNSSLAWHYPLPEEYLRRNPHIISAEQRVYVSSGPKHNHVYPTSKTLERFNRPESANKATSVCGGMIYRDTLLGEEFYGDYFVNEPVHNLVTRMKLRPNGVTFSGHRAADEQESEFLSSTDNWFRPVQVRTGPDGAFWVVDMYRFVIEHPRWIPAGQLEKLDVRAGEDKGRIYRIYPKNQTPRPASDFATISAAELVAALDSPNGVQRDLIQTQLVQRKETNAVPALTRLARESQSPAVRVQALWTLQGLDSLKFNSVQSALTDEHPGVRRNAIRLSEPFLKLSPELAKATLALVNDPDQLVRYQLALSLGEWNDAAAGRALGKLALEHMNDRWMRTAILSSSVAHPGEVLEVILTSPTQSPGRGDMIGGLISTAVGSEDQAALGKVLNALAANSKAEAWRFTALANLVEALERRQIKLDDIIKQSGAGKQAVRAQLDELLAQARTLAFDDNAELKLREAALRLFGFRSGLTEEELKNILAIFESNASPSLRDAALGILRRNSNPQLAAMILQDWPHRLPKFRLALLDLLLSREEWTDPLLDALENGTISGAEMTVANRDRLLKNENAEWRNRAEKVLAAFRPKDRTEVLTVYRGVAGLAGNNERGAEVFNANCAACHHVRGVGHPVGPDITLFRDKGVPEFLEAILDPNAIIEPRFITYNVELKDDRFLSGIIANESANSLTIVQAGNVRENILRSEVSSLRASSLSLMPEGLEQSISPQQMADLIVYLKGSAPRSFGSATPESASEARAAFLKMNPNGVAKVTVASELIDYASWLGTLTFPHCRQTDGKSRVVWETEAVPAKLQSNERHAFRFAGGLGHYGQPSGKFDLKLNGRKVLEFGVTLKDESWAGPDGAVRMSYEIKEVGKSDGNGIFIIDVPAALLEAGQPATFEVVGSASKSLRWFGLHLLSRDALALTEKNDNTPLAKQLLDDNKPTAMREVIIQSHPGRAVEFLKGMTADLPVGTPEEYRRIPWIWRVTIAAGKRHDAAQIKELLDVSLPQMNQPLRDWQAVAIGGGLINGISQLKHWPGERIDEIIGKDAALRQRWNRALDLSAIMAEDEKVRHGTRYDALRMIALQSWEQRGAQLKKYLSKDAHPELQQGAVSGLADMNTPEATRALIKSLNDLTDANRNFALDALLRSPDRMNSLLDAIENRQVAPASLGLDRTKRLTTLEDAALRLRARHILKDSQSPL